MKRLLVCWLCAAWVYAASIPVPTDPSASAGTEPVHAAASGWTAAPPAAPAFWDHDAAGRTHAPLPLTPWMREACAIPFTPRKIGSAVIYQGSVITENHLVPVGTHAPPRRRS